MVETFDMALLFTYLSSSFALPNNVAAVYAVFGVIFHLGIQQITLDFHVQLFIAGCAVSWAISVAAYFAFTPFGFLSAVITSTANATSFTFGLGISIVTYRLFFHRLHSFPGPWGAKVSRFYLAARIFRSLQYHIVLDDWHRRYGDFVRTGMSFVSTKIIFINGLCAHELGSAGPREVSVSRVSAVRAVHGPSSPCVKAAWYAHVSNNVSKVSIHMTRDLEVHRLRRRAWDRGFSTKCKPYLVHVERMLCGKLSVLINFSQPYCHMSRLSLPKPTCCWPRSNVTWAREDL